ncbi:MAG: hypothetical protein ABUL64_00370 [Singulisphaera sp.]
MSSDVQLRQCVEEFANSIEAQTDAIRRGDSEFANVHAQRYIAAFEKLRKSGNSGRDALAALFVHPRADVRTAAAAFLLRHNTDEALDVLRREAAAGTGFASFEASQAIKRWEEGDWNLDPEI